MIGQVLKIAALGILLGLIEGCGFGNDAVIEGSVYDNFNQPLESASIEILDSNFKAETDSKGKFRIAYVPGNLKVKISAPGHTSRIVQLNINQSSKYPLDDSVLAKIPEADGIYLIGSAGYVPLAPSQVNSIQLSGGMTPTYSYNIQSTDDWALVEIGLVEELLKLAKTSEPDVLAFVDSTAGTYVPMVLNGSSFGKGSGDPFKGNGFENVEEESINEKKFVVRKLSYPVSQLIEGKMLCFAPTGRNILGVQMILSDNQAYCISGSKDGFNVVRVREPIPEEYAQLPIDVLQKDAATMAKADFLFGFSCKGCHGQLEPSKGGGTDLSHGLSLTRGEVEKITQVMQNGLAAQCPPMKAALGNQGIQETTHYVLALGGIDHDTELAQKGEKRFDMICAACHGRDGSGNFQLFAADLTDDSWIYGNSESEIAAVLTNGVFRRMPSCNEMYLSDAQCQVLIAYVQGSLGQ